MRWLYKLEYKYGRYYIKNLVTIMVAIQAVVLLFDMTPNISLSAWMYFDRALILQGQWWRVLTFLFLPPGSSMFWSIISLFVYFMMGRSLEQYWGGFKLNVYYIMGCLFAILAGFISPLGIGTNTYLNSSLMLALATLAPDTAFRIYFVIPIKAIWMVVVYFVLTIPNIISAFLTPAFGMMMGLNALVLLGVSLLHYFIFFGPTLWNQFSGWLRTRRNRRNWVNRNR